MNWVSGADLVAAVSNAGGLGTLGPNAGAKKITPDVEHTGERLRSEIKKVRSLTTKPFAVNIAIGTSEGQRRYSQKCVEVALEEKVTVAVVSVGGPEIFTDVLKDGGVKVLHAVSTVRHARKAEEAGVHAVICEGFEAGGHKGFTELTTFVLIPMVADAVSIPVLAGGGIADARGLVAALALGADGVYMGTRFMVSKESDSHKKVKDAIIRGEDACTVTVPKDIMVARDLKNLFTQGYLGMKETGAAFKDLKGFLAEHSQYRAQSLGDVEGSEICCGQVAGLIPRVERAADIIHAITTGARASYKELGNKLSVLSRE